MRGEKVSPPPNAAFIAGSPPHARGKAVSSLFCPPRNRITPACAGKRCNIRILQSPMQDHPRMRGEKLPANPATACTTGSPPHARGKD